MEEVIEVTESKLAQALKIWAETALECPDDFSPWETMAGDISNGADGAKYLIQILKTL